jgi:hypothetical protein
MLAAASAIAAKLGKPGGDEPGELMAWLAKQEATSLVRWLPAAIAGVRSVLAEESELRELWQEADDDYAVWRANVEGLLERLLALQ